MLYIICSLLFLGGSESFLPKKVVCFVAGVLDGGFVCEKTTKKPPGAKLRGPSFEVYSVGCGRSRSRIRTKPVRVMPTIVISGKTDNI